MQWRRERNFDGSWGYCKVCGNKAYQARPPYSICAGSCGYIETYRGVTYQQKNTLTLGTVV